MTNDELCARIRQELYALQDLKYRDFNSSLIPNIEKRTIIGVRVPEVRKLAKKLFAEIDCFRYFNILPHGYFEENLLHAFMIEKINDFDICIKAAEDFLPYIDNWAVCDSFFPPVFKKQKEKLLPRIPRLIKSGHTYTVRYAIEILMRLFLDESFKAEYLETVSSVVSEDYYVNMMRAWYFATALAKQYESAIVYIKENRLDDWTHNMTIKKAVESRRISAETKSYLKTFRRNG
ncbi:MAG: DNA alkylation repair protein [Treponema sp.]